MDQSKIQNEKLKLLLDEYRDSQNELVHLSGEFEKYKIDVNSHLKRSFEEDATKLEKIIKVKERTINEID